jgi:DNA-binding HxlR family transcriptional regulator
MYEKKNPNDLSCGIGITLEIIGGKWKPCLINCIHRGIHRPSELARHNPTASKRVLTLQLKELEAHGVVRRVIYPELPPKVEFFLTERGESLLPIIHLMEKWGGELTTEFEGRN